MIAQDAIHRPMKGEEKSMLFTIIRQDITQKNVDAIVNAAGACELQAACRLTARTAF